MRRILMTLCLAVAFTGCLDFEQAREDCLARGDCLGSLIPPTLEETVPANQAADVPVDAQLEVTFSREMDVGSIVVVVAPPVALGSRLWNESQTSFVVQPSSALDYDTQYSVSITGRARDGVLLGEDARFTFTTEAEPDTTAPTLISTSPQSGASDVSVGFKISVTFSEAIDPASLSLSSQPGFLWGDPTWSGDGRTATFQDPVGALEPTTDYTVQVEAADLAGNALAGLKTFSFRTGELPDTIPPQVVGTEPAQGSVDVSVSAAPSITFSEPMNAASVSTAFTVTPALPGGCSVLPDSTGTIFTCNHGQALAESTEYTVHVGPAAEDGAGNPLGSEFSFSFTTGLAPDVTPPTVTATTPVDNSAGASQTTSIAVTFSEPMEQSTAEAAFTIAQPSSANGGTFSWDQNGEVMTYTLPSGFSFNYGTDVIFQIGAGAKDLAGNAIQSQSFTFKVIQLTSGLVIYADASGNYDDGWVNSNTLPFPYPVEQTTLQVGDDASNHDVRAFVSFNLGAALPPDTVSITAATLTLRQATVSGAPYGNYGGIYAFGFDWGNGLISTTAFNATPYCPWNFQTCMNVNACMGVTLSTSTSLQSWTASVTKLVSIGFNNSAKRASFRLERRTTPPMVVGCGKAAANSINDIAYFTSSEASANQPYLTVSYTHP